MGQNADVQKEYWEILKQSKWNKSRISKPKYSVLEAVLIENPDFNKLDILTLEIEKEANFVSNEIMKYLF